MTPRPFAPTAQIDSWVLVDLSPTSDEAVESGEVRMDESNPTTEVPPTIEPPFSALTDVADQVHLHDSVFDRSTIPCDDFLLDLDDGSGRFMSIVFTAEERIGQVLEKYKHSSRKPHHILAQPWLPISIFGDRVLKSFAQYAIGPLISNDHVKKEMSKRYVFDISQKVLFIDEQKSNKSCGVTDEHVPQLSTMEMGVCVMNRWVSIKAFRHGKLQWAPNLHLLSKCGQHYMIFGTLALPVFECSTNLCVGVFELIIDSPEIDYAAEVKEIDKLLQEVHLRTDIQLINQSRQMVLVEILNMLRKICQAQKLPLAQTWLPCMCCGESSQTMQICMSSAEIPFIMMDSNLFPFWKVSSMYHMCKGQGVAGRAFSSKALCFCNDITQFPDENFPLVHTTRKFQVYGSLAICLTSSCTGNNIYIVQFFLPNRLINVKERKNVVYSIIETMKHNFGSLSLVSSELEEIIDAKLGKTIKRKWLNEPNATSLSNACVELGVLNANMIPTGEVSTTQLEDNLAIGDKKIRKKKAEDFVSSREDLLPYLRGTLNDAATALGVSKATMKRIPKRFNLNNWTEARQYFGVPPTKRSSKANKCDQVIEDSNMPNTSDV